MSLSISFDGSVIDVLNCTGELCSTDNPILGYVPTYLGNLIITSTFGVFLIAQAICWFFYRTHSFTLAALLGLALEIVGYLARVQLHTSSSSSTSFLVYSICLAIAPFFLMAAVYVTFCRVIMHYGPQNSRFTPRQIILFFLPFDTFALIVQAVGASFSDAKIRSYVMGVGFILQVISLILFAVQAAEFLVKSGNERKVLRNQSWAKGMIEGPNPDSKAFKVFLGALVLTTFLLLLRTIFRLLLATSIPVLTRTEAPFLALESGPILLSAFLLALFHPGRYIGKQQWQEQSGWEVRSKPSLTLDLDKELELESARPSDVFNRPWPFSGEGNNYGDSEEDDTRSSIYKMNTHAS